MGDVDTTETMEASSSTAFQQMKEGVENWLKNQKGTLKVPLQYLTLYFSKGDDEAQPTVVQTGLHGPESLTSFYMVLYEYLYQILQIDSKEGRILFSSNVIPTEVHIAMYSELHEQIHAVDGYEVTFEEIRNLPEDKEERMKAFVEIWAKRGNYQSFRNLLGSSISLGCTRNMDSNTARNLSIDGIEYEFIKGEGEGDVFVFMNPKETRQSIMMSKDIIVMHDKAREELPNMREELLNCYILSCLAKMPVQTLARRYIQYEQCDTTQWRLVMLNPKSEIIMNNIQTALPTKDNIFLVFSDVLPDNKVVCCLGDSPRKRSLVEKDDNTTYQVPLNRDYLL
jgi:hypothetical protein